MVIKIKLIILLFSYQTLKNVKNVKGIQKKCSKFTAIIVPRGNPCVPVSYQTAFVPAAFLP